LKTVLDRDAGAPQDGIWKERVRSVGMVAYSEPCVVYKYRIDRTFGRISEEI
jgi:hypothetical protein